MLEYIITIDPTKVDYADALWLIKQEMLVRCGNCKYCETSFCSSEYCFCTKSNKSWMIRKRDWYCADGVMRDDK